MKRIEITLILLILASIQLISKQIPDTMEIKTNEVVVSAMRYPERIIEVPMAIDLISPLKYNFSKGFGLDEALKTIPGVFTQSRFGNQDVRITIRGFGARGAGDRSNAGTSRGIKFFVDGIPETEPDGRTSFDNIDLSFAESIEVIRSNASAIWGNSAGGVVSISTAPVSREPFVKFNTLFGSYGFQKYTFQTGSRLGNGVIYLNSGLTKSDGYRVNSASEKYQVNVGIKNNLDERTLLGVNIMGVSNKYSIPGPLTQEQFDTMPSMANTDYNSRQERRFNRLGRIGLTLEHNLDANNNLAGMAFVTSKFLQRSERNTFRDFTRYNIGGSFSFRNYLEIRDNIKNTLLAGIDESYQDGAILFYSLKNGQRDSLKTDKAEGANSFGAFIQDEVIFGEQLSVILGARYDRIDYYNALYFERPNYYPDFSEDKIYDHITPKIALSWRFNPDHSVYLNYGGGVEVPAGNEVDPMSDTVLVNPLLNEPIISTTYELGTKQIFNTKSKIIQSFNYDAALYYIQVKNELVPYKGGKFYMPAGKTSRYGLELSANMALPLNLYLSGAFTYSNNKYDEYFIDSALIKSSYKGKADYSDHKIAGLPDTYYYLALKYSNRKLSSFSAEVNMQGVSAYFSDDANQI